MLLRKHPEGVIAISQPAHAWVSGQLARHWTHADFEGVREEVCLAAEQHDIGFLAWDQAPDFNRATGLPYTFLEMPRAAHLEIWTRGIQQMLQFGRYPALLVSRHFSGLARMDSNNRTDVPDAPLLEFLDRQEAFQTSLETSLANDFYYGEFSTKEILVHHQRLVSLWDWMSLLFCHGITEPQTLVWAAREGQTIPISVEPVPHDGNRLRVNPWPFECSSLGLICEGRHLIKPYQDEPSMREALRAAAPVVLTINLEPG